MNTPSVEICPRKLVVQSNREVDITVDGFSPEPLELTVCDPECQGPVTAEPGNIRQIGSRLLPGIIAKTSSLPSCPQI